MRRKDSGWAFVLDVGRQSYRQCPDCSRAPRHWTEDGDIPDECDKCGAHLVEREGRRQRWSTGHARKRDAEEALAKALGRLDQGGDPVPAKITVAEWLDAWLAETVRARVATGKLAATTAQGYESHCRVHLRPRLGRVELRKLRPGQVEAVLADLQAEGRSAGTARSVRATLSRALSDAMRDEVVDRNVAQIADPPRVDKRPPSAFTADEVRAILVACGEDRLGAMFLLGLYTGMRSSELRGLRWSDVDLDAGTYRVTTTMHRISKKAEAVVGTSGLVEGRPKNDGSGETTAMSAAAVEVLREHRKEQAAERLASPVWQDTDRVFATSVGTPMDASNVAHAWTSLLDKAGVAHETADGRGRGLHELRRTFATMLREAGIPLEDVQRLGRWASPQVLLDSYRATRDESLRAAADTLGDAIGGGR